MIDQERVREMTRMSILESGIGTKELNISTYKRIDYIVLSMIKGFFTGTLCFAAMFMLWFFWKWEDLNRYFADADYMGFIKKMILYYVIFMILYLALCAAVAWKRHRACARRKKNYVRYLRRLNKSYAEEEDGTPAQDDPWEERSGRK